MQILKELVSVGQTTVLPSCQGGAGFVRSV